VTKTDEVQFMVNDLNILPLVFSFPVDFPVKSKMANKGYRHKYNGYSHQSQQENYL